MTEVRSFLGLARYYTCRRFVKGFSNMTIRLTQLTWKNVKFNWSEECEKSLARIYKSFFVYAILLPHLTIYISNKLTNQYKFVA
jgi:hypothetical protein